MSNVVHYKKYPYSEPLNIYVKGDSAKSICGLVGYVSPSNATENGAVGTISDGTTIIYAANSSESKSSIKNIGVVQEIKVTDPEKEDTTTCGNITQGTINIYRSDFDPQESTSVVGVVRGIVESTADAQYGFNGAGSSCGKIHQGIITMFRAHTHGSIPGVVNGVLSAHPNYEKYNTAVGTFITGDLVLFEAYADNNITTESNQRTVVGGLIKEAKYYTQVGCNINNGVIVMGCADYHHTIIGAIDYKFSVTHESASSPTYYHSRHSSAGPIPSVSGKYYDTLMLDVGKVHIPLSNQLTGSDTGANIPGFVYQAQVVSDPAVVSTLLNNGCPTIKHGTVLIPTAMHDPNDDSTTKVEATGIVSSISYHTSIGMPKLDSGIVTLSAYILSHPQIPEDLHIDSKSWSENEFFLLKRKKKSENKSES